MTRRSISTLLAACALIAAVLVWISISVIGEPSSDGSDAAVQEPEHAKQSAPDPSLSPSPSFDPISPAPDSPTTSRAAVPQVHGESAALPGVDHELRDALWVEGRVVVPPGTPPDELVEVIANGNPYETRPLHSSPIGADGSFRVAFAPSTLLGTLDLTAKYLYLEEAVTVSPPQPPRDILLAPRLGGRIHARVVLSSIALPLRSSIVGSSGRAQRPLREQIRLARIDEHLEFDLEGLPPASDYEVWVAARGSSSIPLRGVQVELGRTTFVDVDLDLGATISGRVYDANGAATNRTQVVARLLGETEPTTPLPEIRRALSDPSGGFVLTELTPGAWELTAMALGFAESLPLVVHLSAGRSVEDVRLELRRPGRIAGRVLGVDGQPAVYASVSVKSDPRWDRAFAGTEYVAGISLTTDKHGDFEFESLIPGEYRIEVTWHDPARGGEAHRSGITLAEGECVENVLIRLERPGRIEGRVTGQEGRPAVDVFVSTTDVETGIERSGTARTDESGKFALERVPPGESLVVVSGGRLVQVGETRIALRPGEVVQTAISVQAGTVLTVYLEEFGGDPTAMTVSVFDDKGAFAGTASPKKPWRSTGFSSSVLVCTFRPLLPGRYLVEAAAGEVKASRSVTLSGQESELVHLRASR